MNLNDLQNLSKTDLEAVIARAQREIDRKDSLRAKELWGNVIAAINKYTQVTGKNIVINGAYAARDLLDRDRLDKNILGELWIK